MKKFIFWGFEIFLGIVVCFLVFQGNYGFSPFLLWFFSIILMIAYSGNSLPSKRFSKLKKHWLPIVIIFAFYLFRFSFLLDPQSLFFHGDEAIVSFNAQEALEKGLDGNGWELLGVKGATLNLLPALWYYFQGVIIKIFGPSVFSTKFFSFIADIGIVLLLYQLVFIWLGRSLAFAVALVYSALPITIHFAMTGYQNIQSTFFLFLMILFLTKGEKQEKEKARSSLFLRAGLVAGLGMYFYLSSVLTPVIGFIFLFIWFIWDWRLWLKSSLFFLAGFLVSAAPFLTYSIFKYNFIAGRSGAYNFLFEKHSLAGVFLDQARRFILGFYPGPFNGSGMFYLNLPAFPHPFILGLFLLGLLVSIWKIRKRNSGYFEGIVIILITSLFGGILTDMPPAPQRLIHLFPIMAFLIVIGINQLSKLIFRVAKNYFSFKFLFWFLIAICLFINLFFFITKNIPYYRSFPKNELSFAQYYIKNNFQEPVFLHIPVHKKYQIYFYSKGLLLPQMIGTLVSSGDALDRLSGIDRPYLYLTDLKEKGLLKENLSLKKEKLYWPNSENYILYRVEY